MPKKAVTHYHTIQIVLEFPREYKEEEEAYHDASEMAASLKKEYPIADIETHVWTHTANMIP